MKITTWNVNGIRARAAQVSEWLDKERPEIVCLQEIKATSAQVPAGLCDVEGYWSFWHGGARGYSGVALLVRKEFAAEAPRFSHPEFDFENRMVVAEMERATKATSCVGAAQFDTSDHAPVVAEFGG